MSQRSDVTFVIDGTFEGLMCALFYGYSQQTHPTAIVGETHQVDLFAKRILISTEPQKARRVIRGIVKKLTFPFYQTIYTAFLAEEESRFLSIYNFVKLGLEQGPRAQSAIAVDCVNHCMKLAQYVSHEAHLLSGFARFSELKSGALYAKVSPNADCLTLLLNHFTDRLSTERFLIHDVKRGKAAVSLPPGQSMIVEVNKLPPIEVCEDEAMYQKLWRQFYHSIANESRKNLKLQTNNLRKRFRPFMTEFFVK